MPEIFFDDRYFHGGLDSRDGPLTRALPEGTSFVAEGDARAVDVATPRPAPRSRIPLDERQAMGALEAAGYAARLWWESGKLAIVRTVTRNKQSPYNDLIVFAVGKAGDIAREVERQAGAGPWRTLMRGPDQTPGIGTKLTGDVQDPDRPAPGIFFEDDFFQGRLEDDLTWAAAGSFIALGNDDGVDGLPDPFLAAGYAMRMWHEWSHGCAHVTAQTEDDNPTVFAVGSADELYARFKYTVDEEPAVDVDERELNPAPVVTQQDLVGHRVRVHYNLHRCPGGPRGPAKSGEACFVVSEKVGGAWKVTGYVSELLLEDADFKVSLAGVRSIREKGQRAVVAWINGTVTDAAAARRKLGDARDWEGVSFNPFKADTFYREDGRPIEEAPLVYLSGRRAAVKLRTSNPGGEPIRSESDLRRLVRSVGGSFDDEP